MEKYSDKWERKREGSYKGCAISAVGVLLCLLALLVMTIVSSCTTPKITEEHHHHYSQTDSVAVMAVVDGRLSQVKEQWVREMYVAMQSQLNEQNTEEQQKERVTETITMWVDSMGRQMRQEQRTTERDISRQQQLREERMTKEWENRLLTMTDSLNGVWQERLDSVAVHEEVEDSASVHQEPVPGDNRPWYRKVWDAVKWMLIGAVVFAVLWFTRKLWSPWLRLLT